MLENQNWTKLSKTNQACLVIEDNLFDQKRIARALQSSDRKLNLFFCATLQEARASLEKIAFDMILLDNNLPDGTGADFALELARHPVHRKRPIVMVSDWPSPFMWDKARQAGVYFVLTKDEFDFEYVQQAMEKAKRRVH